MTKLLNRVTVAALSIFVLTAMLILTAGCSKNNEKQTTNQKTAVTTAKKTKISSPFAYIPYKCDIIGSVNIAKISKLESIQKHMQKTENLPYMKELKASGMDINNIKTISFGITPDILDQANPVQEPEAKGVIIVNTAKEISIAKFIALTEAKDGIKYKKEEINKVSVYSMPAQEENGVNTYMAQLSEDLVAVGTKDMLTQTIDLFKNKGKSVIDDSGLMRLSNNADREDMFWIACLIPENAARTADNKNAPKINNGIIYANYADNILNIGGTINCPTNQDVQKILLPAQMIISLAAMNSNNALKAEDISLKANNNSLLINIKIPKAALENLAKKKPAIDENQANPPAAGNGQVVNQEQPEAGIAQEPTSKPEATTTKPLERSQAQADEETQKTTDSSVALQTEKTPATTEVKTTENTIQKTPADTETLNK